MKILVDAGSGDNAPGELVAGALQAAASLQAQIVLIGREAEIAACAGGPLPPNVSVVHAPDIITMEESPAAAIKEKPASSLMTAIRALADGQGDALVSAGNTGALLSGATLYVKRVKGIRRAALCPLLPSSRGLTLLIDCGANVECTPEYLLQFACMGSFYVGRQLGIENPRVGLLNIGAEETKGTPLQKETYPLLKKAHEDGLLNFIGNIEGRDVPLGGADVVVSDGYSGNILLKTLEGTGILFAGMLKKMLLTNTRSKLAALLLRGPIAEFRKVMDYAETGGSPLLGLRKPVVKAHGASNAKAVKNAIRQAKIFAESGVIEAIEQNIDKMKQGSALDDGA
jgi:glycerol-3-phosphate acyltransferase PlsX